MSLKLASFVALPLAVVAACSAKQGSDAEAVTAATEAITRAYCEGIVPCCPSSANATVEACLRASTPKVRRELEEILRPNGTIEPSRRLECVDAIRNRAARCIRTDTSLVHGVVLANSVSFPCDLYIGFGDSPCTSDADCGPLKTCLPAANTQRGHVPAHCITIATRQSFCHDAADCSSSAPTCVIDACQKDPVGPPPPFTGYEATDATCAF
ncbi:MAG TPA: hypothetical protein VLT33_24335 [Labilithrix sp.]|nr:hypothetical protein [Labilithrix sp.]